MKGNTMNRQKNKSSLDLITLVLVCILSLATGAIMALGAGKLLISSAQAATVWTVQPERYHTYNTTPTKATQSLTRIRTTDIEAINPAWVKIGGVWIKEISTGGAVRYTAEPVVVPPVIDGCTAEFVCHPQWGWIIDLSGPQVLKCPAVKITNEQAAFWDAALSTNSGTGTTCPVYPK
jgi:hypothetical protein